MLGFFLRAGKVLACVTVLAVLSGCPEGPTVEAWVFNTSDDGTVIRISFINQQTDERTDYDVEVPPNTARIVPDIPAGAFVGSPVRVLVRSAFGPEAETGSDNAGVDEVLEDGATLPLITTGNSVLSHRAEYLPLEEGSKGLLMLRKHLQQGKVD